MLLKLWSHSQTSSFLMIYRCQELCRVKNISFVICYYVNFTKQQSQRATLPLHRWSPVWKCMLIFYERSREERKVFDQFVKQIYKLQIRLPRAPHLTPQAHGLNATSTCLSYLSGVSSSKTKNKKRLPTVPCVKLHRSLNHFTKLPLLL